MPAAPGRPVKGLLPPFESRPATFMAAALAWRAMPSKILAWAFVLLGTAGCFGAEQDYTNVYVYADQPGAFALAQHGNLTFVPAPGQADDRVVGVSFGPRPVDAGNATLTDVVLQVATWRDDEKQSTQSEYVAYRVLDGRVEGAHRSGDDPAKASADLRRFLAEATSLDAAAGETLAQRYLANATSRDLRPDDPVRYHVDTHLPLAVTPFLEGPRALPRVGFTCCLEGSLVTEPEFAGNGWHLGFAVAHAHWESEREFKDRIEVTAADQVYVGYLAHGFPDRAQALAHVRGMLDAQGLQHLSLDHAHVYLDPWGRGLQDAG